MSSNIEIRKICQDCGNSFIARTTVTKFCSHKCASRNNKKRKRDEKLQQVALIQAIEPTTLQLYSLQGQLQKEIKADKNTQVDISGLASGIYLLKEINGSTAYKVIKE